MFTKNSDFDLWLNTSTPLPLDFYFDRCRRLPYSKCVWSTILERFDVILRIYNKAVGKTVSTLCFECTQRIIYWYRCQSFSVTVCMFILTSSVGKLVKREATLVSPLIYMCRIARLRILCQRHMAHGFSSCRLTLGFVLIVLLFPISVFEGCVVYCMYTTPLHGRAVFPAVCVNLAKPAKYNFEIQTCAH